MLKLSFSAANSGSDYKDCSNSFKFILIPAMPLIIFTRDKRAVKSLKDGSGLVQDIAIAE